jgi:hypothetical protein
MSTTSYHPKPTKFELQGRAEWLRLALESAHREGREISAAERAVFDRYANGEISGEEARREIVRLFEVAHSP